MESAQKVAMVRGLITAVFTGVLAFLGAWQTSMAATDVATNDALLAAGVGGAIAFCTVMLARFGAEGTVDAARDARNGGGG